MEIFFSSLGFLRRKFRNTHSKNLLVPNKKVQPFEKSLATPLHLHDKFTYELLKDFKTVTIFRINDVNDKLVVQDSKISRIEEKLDQIIEMINNN